jgi:hypothetical protein
MYHCRVLGTNREFRFDQPAQICKMLSSPLCYTRNMPTKPNPHARLDERSLALHTRVAEKLEADPALLAVARANLARWQAADDTPSLVYAEWERILDEPLEAITRLLTDRSERATQLRQSSPFAGILTDAERSTIYESYSARTYHQGRQPDLG